MVQGLGFRVYGSGFRADYVGYRRVISTLTKSPDPATSLKQFRGSSRNRRNGRSYVAVVGAAVAVVVTTSSRS